MRIGLLVMCLFFIFSLTFAAQAPSIPLADPEPPAMEFRVNEYRNMVVAAWVLSSMVAIVGTVFLAILLMNSIIIPGLLTTLIALTAVSVLWMGIIWAVSRGIRRSLRQHPDVFAGTMAEKQYYKWRDRMLGPWLMTTIPLGFFLVMAGIVGLLFMIFWVA